MIAESYVAVAPGRTSIRLEYVRPWEHDTPPASVRTVGVVVEDPPGALP
jgi:predicted secreted protein